MHTHLMRCASHVETFIDSVHPDTSTHAHIHIFRVQTFFDLFHPDTSAHAQTQMCKHSDLFHSHMPTRKYFAHGAKTRELQQLGM